MKHLSLYNDFKKYVIFYGKHWLTKTIYMVKFEYLIDDMFYYSNFWYIGNTGEIDTNNDDNWKDSYNIEHIVILYQTDNFDNGLEKLKLIATTQKYNL